MAVSSADVVKPVLSRGSPVVDQSSSRSGPPAASGGGRTRMRRQTKNASPTRAKARADYRFAIRGVNACTSSPSRSSRFYRKRLSCNTFSLMPASQPYAAETLASSFLWVKSRQSLIPKLLFAAVVALRVSGWPLAAAAATVATAVVAAKDQDEQDGQAPRPKEIEYQAKELEHRVERQQYSEGRPCLHYRRKPRR